MKQILWNWKIYSSWKYELFRKNMSQSVIKAYQFRFKRLFNYFRWSAKRIYLNYRKIVILKLWNKKSKETILKNNIKSNTFRSNYLRKLVFDSWQKHYFSLKRLIISQKCLLEKKNINILRSLVVNWKNLVLRNKNIKKFIIKRLRNFIKKSIKFWHQVKIDKQRLKYLKFKSEELCLYRHIQKGFQNWKSYIESQHRFRKEKVFFVYWKREYIKNKQSFEKYIKGCRERHLKNFYFKSFKAAFSLSKLEKLADGLLLKNIFFSFKRKIAMQKLFKIKINESLQYCFDTYYYKTVNLI